MGGDGGVDGLADGWVAGWLLKSRRADAQP